MQQAQPATPQAAFQATSIIHYNFMGAVVLYIVVGEIMRVIVDDFAGKGFNDFSGTLAYSLRAIVLLFAIAATVIARTIFSDEAMLARQLTASHEVDDMDIAGALQTAHIVRLAFIEAIAVLGLVIYMNSGDRIDYVWMIIAFVNLLPLIPSRDRWNQAYRRMAIDHPGVTSMPL